MKLSEVKNERTFNLEISESDLRLLFGATQFFPARPEENYTNEVEGFIGELYDTVSNLGIRSVSRDDFITY